MSSAETNGAGAASPPPAGALGVGTVYWPELEPLIRAGGNLIQVLELEPQTFWRREPGAAGGYVVDRKRLDLLRALPGRRILHGVGFPVGSIRPPDPAHLPAFAECVELCAAAWASEHLNFNRAQGSGGTYDAGFLLPPCQTADGAAAAAIAARATAAALPVPFLVENGVSYLAERPGELSDGAFLRRVVEAADCGILLDLHNAWANDLNGRQPIREFLDDIPLERVQELHLAGGLYEQGYWLDAHSGPMPPGLRELAAELIPRLPQLQAIIFEVAPSHVELVGLDAIEREIERLHELWSLRRPAAPTSQRASAAAETSPIDRQALPLWEDSLAALVNGHPAEGRLAVELAGDPGISIYRRLIAAFRASAVVSTLPFTGRLLLASLGAQAVDGLLEEFWRRSSPEAFREREARNFAGFLIERGLKLPMVYEVLAYDLAVIDALTRRRTQRVEFSCDPLPLLSALADRRLPDAESLDPGSYKIEVGPEGIRLEGAGPAG